MAIPKRRTAPIDLPPDGHRLVSLIHPATWHGPKPGQPDVIDLIEHPAGTELTVPEAVADNWYTNGLCTVIA